MHVGKYELIKKIATGGMAEVFLARAAGPKGFQKILVVKRILPHLADEPTFVDMFLSEAKLAAQFSHPNIVQIFDFGEVEGTSYIAMEFVDGPNLRTLQGRALDLGTPLPLGVCAKIISLACEGLAYAHDFVDPATGQPWGVVHRDISPDNLLVARNGYVKVVDFGIAKAAVQSHKTKTGTIKGKFGYMAPEQLQNQTLDRRTDVFALGMVLYEMATGTKPFDGSSEASTLKGILFEPFIPAVSRRSDIPRELGVIIDKALSKEREQRYPDCLALQRDLEQFIASTGKPVGTLQIAELVGSLALPNLALELQGTPHPRALATPGPASASQAAALAYEATSASAKRAADAGGEEAFAATAAKVQAPIPLVNVVGEAEAFEPTAAKAAPRVVAEAEAEAFAPTSAKAKAPAPGAPQASASGPQASVPAKKAAVPSERDDLKAVKRSRAPLVVGAVAIGVAALGAGAFLLRGSSDDTDRRAGSRSDDARRSSEASRRAETSEPREPQQVDHLDGSESRSERHAAREERDSAHEERDSAREAQPSAAEKQNVDTAAHDAAAEERDSATADHDAAAEERDADTADRSTPRELLRKRKKAIQNAVLAHRADEQSDTTKSASASDSTKSTAKAESSEETKLRYETLVKDATGLLKENKSKEAEQMFLQAAALEPTRPEALVGVGYAALQRGKAVQAESSFRSALKLDKRRSTTLFGLGQALFIQGRKDEAADYLLRFQELYPQDKRAPEAQQMLDKINE